MNIQEKMALTLQYIDALTRAQNVEPFNEEVAVRLIKACDFFEKNVML